MRSQQIRRQFLNYFKHRSHALIPSSAVVPYEDPSLLFTNAGMNQFKDLFLGKSLRDYKRAVSSQKCIRVGGKHNDLENVGHTQRHLTFFEMLGNFSFGDYFKKEAIEMAWEVSTQVFELESERIWPSVYREDEEAFDLWTRYVPQERIVRLGEADNFWAMGEVGPCGPCSELYYDLGPARGRAKTPAEDPSGHRFLEFWNLVFMQYNREMDGSLTLLPRPSIDTGAGLERVVSLKMGCESVFETDILRYLIAQVEKISHIAYDPSDLFLGPAFRVIADHLRSLAFAIADGAMPSNVERGYVLRKILRRAVRYGRRLQLHRPFLGEIFPTLVESMGEEYPELKLHGEKIVQTLSTEEEGFFRTLKRGGNMLNQVIEQAEMENRRISGEAAFRLKDTYGLPLEEILLMAKDHHLVVDQERFQALEKEARERSKSAHRSTAELVKEDLYVKLLQEQGECHFTGYGQTHGQGKIRALISEGLFVSTLHEGDEGMVILDNTPFYAEMGGQVGDVGYLKGEGFAFQVTECKAPYKGIIAHHGMVEEGELSVNYEVWAEVQETRRQKTCHNHTATHLLHWALNKVLGAQVKQAGSVVDPLYLRFDFTHHKALTHQEIEQIEDLVNEKIQRNVTLHTYQIPYEQAQESEEIKQFFGEKYGSLVRVVDMGFSKELCGGTHAAMTGEIGWFKILKENSIAAGVRRIEAVTGKEAIHSSRHHEQALLSAALLLKTSPNQLLEKLEKLLEENKQLASQLKEQKKQEIEKLALSLKSHLLQVGGRPLLTAAVVLSSEELPQLAEEIVKQYPSLILLLASREGKKSLLLARVTQDLVSQGVSAHQLIKGIAPIMKAQGGGKAHAAQAGGGDELFIDQALQEALNWVEHRWGERS